LESESSYASETLDRVQSTVVRAVEAEVLVVVVVVVVVVLVAGLSLFLVL
jgi:hypothetical protein